ncbi:MAG: FtsX-like permease family protein [Chloroflexota bacterium]
MLKGVLRKKIWSDLFDNMSRTIQVVIIISIGSLAVGAIIGGLDLIQQDITANWLNSSPASIGLSLGDKGIEEDIIETIERFEEVDKAEGQFVQGVKWRRHPDEPWQPAVLRARDDYQDLKLFTLRLEEGDWPRNKVMTVNRGYGIKTGERIYLEINDKVRRVDIGGVTWYQNAPPPNFGGDPIFFTTKEHFTELTGVKNYGYVAASIPGRYDEARAKIAAIRIEAKIEGEDVEVYPGTADDSKVIYPGKHPAQEPINGVFLILQIMAFATLILGLFLVYNTVTAIISQQIPQIGVLKAIGATRSQILLLYYTTVLVYGLLAALVSVPLGAFAAQGLRVWLIDFMTMDPGAFGISLQAVLTQVGICIVSPLIIATLPIFRGAGITVREAISSYGLTGGGGLLDRLLARLSFISRMTSMAVSNTFRNKTRVFMTQITLVGAGVLFMAVLSAQTSIRYTFGPILFDTLRTSILMDFEEKERITSVERLVEQTEPRASDIEMWVSVSGQIRLAGQPETFDDRNVTITGIPIPTEIYGAQIRAGRWLKAEDTFALVLHQKEAAKIGVGLGDWVTFDIPTKRKTDWQVVGLLNDPINDRRIIAPREALLIADRDVGRGNNLYITTRGTTPEEDITISRALRNRFDRHGFALAAQESDTLLLLAEQVIEQFNIIIYLLLMMAVLIAIVGGIALSGALAINVLERRIEIGILRAIGASNSAIGTLFITEGVLLGWLSWLIAVPISYPFGLGLSAAIGAAVNSEIGFDYSVTSVWVWLIIITVLGVAASWFPAKGAVKVSVRESLSYE